MCVLFTGKYLAQQVGLLYRALAIIWKAIYLGHGKKKQPRRRSVGVWHLVRRKRSAWPSDRASEKKKRKENKQMDEKREEREWTERKRRREIHADDTLCVCCVCIRALFTQGKSFRRDATSIVLVYFYIERQVYIYSLLVWPLLLAVKRVPANLCPHLSIHSEGCCCC